MEIPSKKPTHTLNKTSNVSSSTFSSSSSYQNFDEVEVAGEVIGKIDNQTQNDENNDNIKEFSFRKQNSQSNENSITRRGLPPLPPDVLTRQGLTRNQSDVQSPTSTNYKNGIFQMSTIINNNDGDNFKEARVSSSIYSTVEEDDSLDSSTSSSNRDEEENALRNGLHPRKSPEKKSSRSEEVIRCTSSVNKTKSRLMDPPSTPIERSGVMYKSGQVNMRSGLIGKSTGNDDDEEDPFNGDDLPEEFKKGQVSVLLIVEWISLTLLVGGLIFSLVIKNWRETSMWDMRLWKWQVLVIVVICGRLVSDWGIKIIVFFIERNFLLRKRVLYFVYGLKKAVQSVIWLGLVLITWKLLFDDKEKQVTSKPLRVVTRLLVIGEIGAFIWLLKTLLVKVCASFFHVNTFFDRIQESLFNQFVIETLSGPPVFDLQSSQDIEDGTMNEVRKIVQNSVERSTMLSRAMSKKREEGISIESLNKLNQKNVSAWNMKRLMKIVRHGLLTTLDEQIVDATHHTDDSSTQIRSEVEAKAAAKKMFRNVARPRCKYIYMNDLMRFMQEDEAIRTMSLFEGAVESGKISKAALKNWVVNAFRGRRAIALTLSDTKTAVNKLHKIVNVIVGCIILLIGVTMLDIVTYKNLIFLNSQIVLVAFIFGNTCKNVFESIIFLFVIHPFDVGDRCEIDGVQMVVEEMNILTTVFLRYDNQKIYFPNYILLTKPISNYYRSPDMGDAIEFLIHIATPAEKISLIRQRITSYIVNKKEQWYPDPMIILKDAEGLEMLRIAVWFQHRINHQDMGERWTRRGILIEECIKIFRELDLEYRIYPVNVNVSSLPPLSYANLSSTSRSVADGVLPRTTSDFGLIS